MSTTKRVQAGRWQPVVGRDREGLGESEAFLEFQERLSKVAPVNRPVLLLGERGTGKEIAAARLHYLSRRWEGPFVAVNCAALAPSVIESELFGHEAGAFTGAAARRLGRFEAADGGTLFLDEVGQIPMAVQEKILRVVEYKTFERVGGAAPVEVDVRIVSATNVDLPARAAAGAFKRDLLDRLAFEVLHLPPLRERAEDILLLAMHFAVRMAHELGRTEMPDFSPRAIQELERYAWPGNIRELKNVVERSVCRTTAPRIAKIDFDPFHSPFGPHRREDQISEVAAAGNQDSPAAAPSSASIHPANRTPDLPSAVRTLEYEMLRDALEKCRFHQRKTAAALGLTYHQFRGLYRKHRPALEKEFGAPENKTEFKEPK